MIISALVLPLQPEEVVRAVTEESAKAQTDAQHVAQ